MHKLHSAPRRARRRAGRLIALAAFALAATAAAAPVAGAQPVGKVHLYWTVAQLPDLDNCAQGIGSSIARSALDGSQIDERFVNLGGWGCASPFLLGSDVEQLAAYGAHVYWVDEVHHTIARADLDGTHIDDRFIHFPVTDPYDSEPVTGIAVDGRHIYWINGDASGTLRDPVTAIGRANLNGSNVQQRFIRDANAWGGIASDGRHLFWGSVIGDDSGVTAIERADVDGSHVKRLVRFHRGLDGAGVTALAVEGGRLYWGNYDTSTIGSARTDGTDVTKLVDADDVTGLAVSPTDVYWINDIGTSIARADLNGSHVDQSFIADALNPVGIAVSERS